MPHLSMCTNAGSAFFCMRVSARVFCTCVSCDIALADLRIDVEDHQARPLLAPGGPTCRLTTLASALAALLLVSYGVVR